MDRVKNILITNVYSYKNLGDRAIVVAMLKLIKSIYPRVNIFLQSNFYIENKNFYEKYYNTKVIEPLWDGTKGSLLIRYIQSNKYAFKMFLNIKPLKNPIINYDLVLSAGGGYLYSSRRGPLGVGLVNSLYHMYYYKSIGVPTILFPQSIGPLHYSIDKKLVKRVLSKLDVVYSREPITSNLAKELKLDNVREIPDIAFLLEPNPVENIEDYLGIDIINRNYIHIGITVMNWLFARKGRNQKNLDLYLEKLVQALIHLQYSVKKSIKVYIFVQVNVGNNDTDLKVSKLLHEKLNRVGVKNIIVDLSNLIDPENIIFIYSKMDLFIASRMHSAIFALCGYTPTISLAYQPKTKGIFQMVGMSELVLDIEEFDSNELFRIINNTIIKSRSINIKKKIRNNINLLRKRIKIKLEHLGEFKYQ